LLRNLLAVALALVCAVAALSFVPDARAQGAGHGTDGFIVLDQLDTAQRQRARKLFAELVCSCKSENWSKSLLNCPDGCADPQKQEILQQIKLGWDDDRIVEFQVQAYGPRVRGKPDDILTYVLPMLVLIGAGVLVAMVFAKWRASAAAAHADRPTGAPPADEELAAIERELQELR